ncbi:MAG: FAD-dependent oxidoreductase, partial [Bacteroidales bacterium]|nr:FAD-dependent oxidoreductase [Bacteroidales bacterium]
MDFDLIVIGSGPGGYVAAIRAAQLGMNTAIVERSELGGICLNWGCIPTKALLKSAQVFNYMKNAKEYGVSVDGNIEADFEKVIERSRGVSAAMSKGVQYLLGKNKINIINGFGKLKAKNTISVTNENGETKDYTAKHIILATGSRSKELPGIKQDGKKIIGYREALSLPKLPESMLVIGSGAIGTELAYFYHSMGTKITLVEYLPNIVPLE